MLGFRLPLRHIHILTKDIKYFMKKLTILFSLTLAGFLGFASCSSDNSSEPITQEASNYLKGKEFEWGISQNEDPNNWHHITFRFDSNTQGVVINHNGNKATNTTEAYNDYRELAFTYTYTKPTLTMTVTKVNKFESSDKTSETNEVGKTYTYTIQEESNTITGTSDYSGQILVLKK